MKLPFSENPGVAQAALAGTAVRVQNRAGIPDDVIMLPGLQSSAAQQVQQFAEDDLDSVLYGDDPEMGADDGTPVMDRMNEGTTNRTAFLENNYPLAAQADPASKDPMAMLGADPMAMMGGMGGGDEKARQRASILSGLGIR